MYDSRPHADPPMTPAGYAATHAETFSAGRARA